MEKTFKKILKAVAPGCGVCPCGCGWVSVLCVFPVGGACACILVAAAGSLLSEGQCSVHSRFWSVYGFRIPLGSRSCFCGVGRIHSHSCFRGALSAHLQCCQPPTCPWDHCWCFCPAVPPCAAGRNLLDRCLGGSSCGAVTCELPQPRSSPSA